MCSRIILINSTAGHNQKKGNHSSQGTGSSLCGVDCIIRLALTLFLQPTFFTFSSQITSWHKVYQRGRKRANDPGIELALPRSRASHTLSLGVPCSTGFIVYIRRRQGLQDTIPSTPCQSPKDHSYIYSQISIYFFMETRFHSFVILKKNLCPSKFLVPMIFCD